MSYQIKTRTDTAANWTSTNPTLAAGEIATEYDTDKFKIGDGSTSWTGLGYAGLAGPAQTLPYRSLGDGSDGNVTISSGVTTLSVDMYYNNLTINGTGSIYTNGFKIYVKGTLNLAAAPAGAINFNGVAGGDASGATGGTVTAVLAAGSTGTGGGGTAGATATTGAGGTGASANAIIGNGGSSGNSGAGGTGTNAGGAAVAATGFGGTLPFNKWASNLLRGIQLINGGMGGRGGSAGGGDGSNSGGGGGGGGAGGGTIAIYANIIVKSANTPAATIQSNGAPGGRGGDASAGVCGGGGGAAAGGGGWVYIAYNYAAGPRIANFIQCNGGAGGSGGNGFGDGALGGQGGQGSAGGRVNIVNIPNITSFQEFDPTTNNNYIPQGINAFAATTLTGTNGGSGGLIGVSF